MINGYWGLNGKRNMSEAGSDCYAVKIPHPKGDWDAIWCRSEEIAEQVVHNHNTLRNLNQRLLSGGQFDFQIQDDNRRLRRLLIENGINPDKKLSGEYK